MPKLILLLAIIIALVIVVRRVQRLPPHKRRSGFIQLGLIVAAIAAALLTLAGKMHWLGAAITGLAVGLRQLLPTVIRAFPLLQQWLQHRQQTNTGQHSEVRSALLTMTLDHSSGELAGEVLSGPYEGWLLNEMTREQLDELLAFCQQNDSDSAQLLQSYLEQRFPDDDSDAEAEASASASTGGMSRKEALLVLGLGGEPSDEEIIAAHRSLMQKLHPDRGGNDYLAAKINQAKDFLIKH
ncbi:heat shock protein DnaJ domain protein [Luminiphilus syltensis NOR5-1B]|uniref:Heat shock protein DnaJ domain protein n=1 Tax=Luminiphilus syltensis NOR5-1B TaxID=565045 RepID=B8KQL2_9GAMM|nr:molecular chaperone DnaJ [Luminiphilus syltensis]EED36024.1 heat shock protein DnaJ domain protein [Luminiphilus syltensis NOR5-1B]